MVMGECRLWDVIRVTVDGESKVLIDSVAQCHFFYHRLYIDCPDLIFLLHKFVFYIKAVHVGFVVDEVVLGQFYLGINIFPCKLLSHQ